MGSWPENSFLKLLPDTFEKVRQDVNLDKPGEMKEAVRILDEWVKQQAHFRKKYFPSQYLETTIIACKGSVEQSKLVLDEVCTVRTLLPEYFEPFNMKKEYEFLRGKIYEVFTPKMLEGNLRLVIIRVDSFKVDLSYTYKFAYAMVDYMRMKDYQSGIVLVYDLKGDLRDMMVNSNIMDYKKAYSVFLDTFKVRLKKVHVITSSKYVEPLLMMIKPFLKKKIADRIVTHKSAEELHEYYPKEVLPKDLGGYEPCLEEIQERVLEEMSSSEYLEFMRTLYETRTDESLRPEGSFTEQYAGVTGTFRALSID